MTDYIKRKVKYMYYDTFANEYKLYKDDMTLPERYVITFRGNNDFYFEKWKIDSKVGKLLGIAFDKNEYEHTKFYWEKIHNIEKEYGCKFISLLLWTIPAEKFDYYLKEHCYG